MSLLVVCKVELRSLYIIRFYSHLMLISWWKEEYANASSPIIFDMACGTCPPVDPLIELLSDS